MAIETRQIVFSRGELLQALLLYWEHRQELPNGGVETLTVSSGDVIQVTAVFSTIGASKRTMVANEKDVGAALLLICLQQKVPIPRKGKRTLTRVGNRIGLTIQVELKFTDLSVAYNPIILRED